MTAEEADDFENCGYTQDYEMWEFEAHNDYSHYIFYLYVGEGHIAEQEARRDFTNFNPSKYIPSHDSQGTPQTETNSIEQSLDSIEHNSKLGGWINGFGPYLDPSPTNWRSTCCAWSRRNATRPTTSAARPTAGTTPRPRSTTSQSSA